MNICELKKFRQFAQTLSTDFNMKNPRKTFLFEKLYHSLDPKFILPNFISPTDFFIQIFWGRWW